MQYLPPAEWNNNPIVAVWGFWNLQKSILLQNLAKVYDHAKHCYKFGFRMLTLGWSDGSTFLPVNSILLSTENKKNRINETQEIDKRTVGYKRRMLAVEKGTIAMLELLKSAKKADIPAKYVLFDSWFSSPCTRSVISMYSFCNLWLTRSWNCDILFYAWELLGKLIWAAVV